MQKKICVLFLGVVHLHAVNTVTNSNDSGTGSLREQVGLSNTTPDTIDFQAGSSYDITLTSTLTFSQNYEVDASNGANTVTIGGSDIDLDATTTFNNSDAGDFTIDSRLVGGSDGFRVAIKTGDGTIILTGDNTFNGEFSLQGGKVVAGNDHVFGDGSFFGTPNMEMYEGTTLGLEDGISLSAEVLLVDSGDAFFEVEDGSAAIGTAIADNGTVVKIGSGNLTLSGNSDYSGGTVISAGSITVGNDSALSNGSVSVGDGTTLALNNTISLSNAITLTGSDTISVGSGSATLSGVISGTGSFTKSGAGTLILSGENTFSGTVIISAGAITVADDSALSSGTISMQNGSALNLNDTISLSNDFTLAGTDTVDVSTGTATLTGVIAGSGSLTKTGAGTLVISGSEENTYSGDTALTGGQITAGFDNALGTGTVSMADGTTLSVNSNVDLGNDFTLTGSDTIEISAGSSIFSGQINGSGSLEKTGAGTLVLSGSTDNTYSGSTTLTSGQITVNSTDGLGIGVLFMDDSTILEIGSGVGLVNNIEIDGTNTQINVTSGTGTIFAGVDGSSGSFTKNGAGTLVLQGASLYTGDMTVAVGGLTVNGSYAGDIVANSGTTVNGTGTVVGQLTVSAGASLQPGNSIGTITLGSLDLDSSSTTFLEFDDNTSSFIDVTGTADVAGTLSLIQNPGSYGTSGSYEILSAGTLNGTFETITGGLAGYIFALGVSDNSIHLLYTTGSASSTIDTEGLTGNVLKYANYLNDEAPASFEYLALAALSGEDLYNGINSVSPARNAFGPFVSQLTVFSFSRVVNRFLNNQRFVSLYELSKESAKAFTPDYYNLVADDGKVEQGGFLDYEEHGAAIWATGFIDGAHQASESQNVAFDFVSGGVLFGGEYRGIKSSTVGGALGYAQSTIDDRERVGKSIINYYLASVYGDYMWDRVYFEGAFWAVFHQIQTQRQIIYSTIDTKAYGKMDGWQIDPHVELGYIFGNIDSSVEPYISVDCVVNWESGFTEVGAGNLNVQQKFNTSLMVQTKLGLRLCQATELETSRVGIKESVGYINRAPFWTGDVTSAIFGAPETITLVSFSGTQNLAAVGAVFFAEVGENRDTRVSISYEGQFGKKYTFNEGMLTFSKFF